ncbi:acyl-CoA desaturase [Amycolatopsis acidiphila]|uniref:Acyl-CoA desaturase n=1 Tax=Amycolatopsis acidiphila TaxID=715473 RepID=A0A558ACQ8_9PSEU|nr:acyl-CoA desaturase [Amycolatopsis acidiphila]TVT22056.1 acyl-CoA desaturase [Amycolatopsis acidiphila]UIJ63625.1 acyl-CoA desaturase [Amycolatopsis acidiphila]GHG67835.1 fatty acid desaturase [Amycolatopsis acidiphila]
MQSPPKHPFAHLSADQLAELGREFDAIHEQVRYELGDRDRQYIKGVIRLHRQIAVAGRALLLGSRSKTLWAAGTGCLAIAKILENMEIGHNVLHGQWDWMNDPYIHSSTWDWDTASTAEAWKHSHNYIHHTYTNIRGKDKDLGYEIMRIDPNQKWHPAYLAQPFYNLLLMAFFEWGVAVHDLDVEAIRRGEKPLKDVWHDIKGISGKARDQIVKDYLGWPLVSALASVAVGRLSNREPRSAKRLLADRVRGRGWLGAAKAQLSAARTEGAGGFAATFWADFTANIIRNLWAHSIIFCGHFPDQTYTFSQDEVRDETRGAWYARQLVGAANITGSPLFHLMSGNLGYQVEHHLFPDMPSSRYAEIAPKVKDICLRYGLPYNTGPLSRQLGSVHRTIIRLAFPGGAPRPKPGPYQGEPGDDEVRAAA